MKKNIKKWVKPILFTVGGALAGLAYYYFIKCPSGPCQSETPDFDEAYAELGEDIHFLMVNMTTSSRESFATEFIDEQGYSFPVFYDTDSIAAEAYSLPTTYFIDADGYGVAQVTGRH